MKFIWVTTLIIGIAAAFGAPPADAKELRMIAPLIPPHFDENGDGRIGDVIQATLRACGHSVSFTMVPFGRHWKDYRDDESFDGMATAEADQTFPGFTTQPFMNLQDGATVLVGSGLEGIDSVTQLGGKRVVAYPSADQILGIEAVVPSFANFKTRADRFDQVRPLFAGRADVILADGLITAYFIARLRDRAVRGLEPDIDVSPAAVFRRIFEAGPQRLYFRDQAIALDFDRCFQDLLNSGGVDRIAKPYVDRFRSVLGDQYPNS